MLYWACQSSVQPLLHNLRIARAQSLEGARNVANQAQAQQQLTNFLSYGPGYQPGSAQMFH